MGDIEAEEHLENGDRESTIGSCSRGTLAFASSEMLGNLDTAPNCASHISTSYGVNNAALQPAMITRSCGQWISAQRIDWAVGKHQQGCLYPASSLECKGGLLRETGSGKLNSASAAILSKTITSSIQQQSEWQSVSWDLYHV
uniref:Uncharacterized protein n=1 Tax=Pristionchus pacificus TaxID=54126 RepID=A0A2A6CKJ2_PRIPA|eukprot:PDM78639.1 hypothetical protein PRIPAC_31218 [Pristionchus pacificus]